MTDETKKIDELEGMEHAEAGCADVPVDDGLAAMDAIEVMPAVEGVDAPAGKPAAKRKARKGVIAGVAAAVLVIAIGVGVAFANQPASSGVEAPSASSAAAPASTASENASSAAASSSSASAGSASAAASSLEAAASGESPKAESGQASTGGSGVQAQQGGTQTSGSTSGNAGGTTSGSSASGGNAASGNTDTATAQPAHVHNWVAITGPRTVVDKEEWDEPVYETVDHFICNICGDVGAVDGFAHLETHELGASGGYRPVTTQTGTIHHEAITHDEVITTGYRCSECGAIK